MKTSKMLVFALMTLSVFFMTSCSKDADLLSVEESRGGQGGGNNGPGKNNDLTRVGNKVIKEWSDLFLELDRYATGMRPNATARAIAYIYLAAYETGVSGMKDFISNEDQLDGLVIDDSQRDKRVNYELAINRALSISVDHFLLHLPEDQRAKISALEEDLEDDLDRNLRDGEIGDSKAWGDYVAKQVIAYSQTDLEAEQQVTEPQPLSYEPPTGDGYWTYSAEPERALFPYWKSVRTFVVSADETTTLAPISYSEDPDSEYFAQMKEVYEMNNQAKEEDNENLWIAEFWSDDVENLMFSPPARQVSIANQFIKNEDLSLAEALHLMLKLGFSLNDAAVSTWKYKYEHMVMRPNVYIHEFIDPSFQTNLYRLIPWPNPTFPGYPSGHSCFASAAAGVFIDFFGNDINFTDRSHQGRTEFRGMPRTFSSFTQLADENGYSRIPLGVHVRMDCTEGLRLGYEIADGINAYDVRE